MAHPQCCANVPTSDPNSGVGHVETFGGLTTYITGSSQNTNHAILLIADSFGFESPILRNLADKVAAAGYFVVVPDFLNGDPYDQNNADRPFDSWSNDHPIIKDVKPIHYRKKSSMYSSSAATRENSIYHPPIIVNAKAVIEALKHKGMVKIGTASFCWAAQILVGIAKRPFTNGAVLLHPAFISVDDIQGVNVPLEILAAENDVVTTVAVIKEYEDVLKAQNEIDYNVKIFSGVAHGFAVKYDTTDKEAVKKAEEAQKDMLNWFLKHIH